MNRRHFLSHVVNTLSLFAAPKVVMSQSNEKTAARPLCLFLCGDVMTGRGVDQILPFPSDPVLYEPYVRNARRYVDLAEEFNGPIPKPVDFYYIWGEALDEFDRVKPDVRIINLETSITSSDDHWPGKEIHYRMQPKNVPCLTAAGIDCCVLSNNHVLDWGIHGLEETLKTLHAANLKTVGAGANLVVASEPANLELPGNGRVLIFAYGMESSGVYAEMGATKNRPGVNYFPDFTRKSVLRIREEVQSRKRPGDIVMASFHWGGNWGYAISPQQRQFAHQLIDTADVDIIHGHSSHHVKGIEVYHDKLIIYGCGDFLTDYEGIEGYEAYRDDLGLMYFVRVEPASGKLVELEMVPTQIRRFRLQRAAASDQRWLHDVLDREGRRLNTRVETGRNDSLFLRWQE
jgi:poly-gamma-glutamate synthesis protein (capsule biosynthesis protein)